MKFTFTVRSSTWKANTPSYGILCFHQKKKEKKEQTKNKPRGLKLKKMGKILDYKNITWEKPVKKKKKRKRKKKKKKQTYSDTLPSSIPT
jgi:hypothetical protein